MRRAYEPNGERSAASCAHGRAQRVRWNAGLGSEGLPGLPKSAETLRALMSGRGKPIRHGGTATVEATGALLLDRCERVVLRECPGVPCLLPRSEGVAATPSLPEAAELPNGERSAASAASPLERWVRQRNVPLSERFDYDSRAVAEDLSYAPHYFGGVVTDADDSVGAVLPGMLEHELEGILASTLA